MPNKLTLVALVLAVAVTMGGFGYGALKAGEARRAAERVAEVARELEDEKTAHRAARAAAEALRGRLKAAEKLNKEKQRHDALDQAALAEAQEWAAQPLPGAIRLRLLDN